MTDQDFLPRPTPKADDTGLLAGRTQELETKNQEHRTEQLKNAIRNPQQAQERLEKGIREAGDHSNLLTADTSRQPLSALDIAHWATLAIAAACSITLVALKLKRRPK